MHLFLFTNSAQRELVSICTQSIRNCNKLSLHYSLAGLQLFTNFIPYVKLQNTNQIIPYGPTLFCLFHFSIYSLCRKSQFSGIGTKLYISQFRVGWYISLPEPIPEYAPATANSVFYISRRNLPNFIFLG